MAASMLAAIIEYQPAGSPVMWLSLETAKDRAQQVGRPIYLDVYAQLCAPCQQMDKLVFSNDSVRTILNTYYIPARVDIDDSLGERVKMCTSREPASGLQCNASSITHKEKKNFACSWFGKCQLVGSYPLPIELLR